MAYVRDLTDEERRLCETLGGVVIFWNHVEGQIRSFLHYAVGAFTHRTNVLIANLGNVSLAEAITAIADDHDAPISDHMRHVAKLFDALRVYRNHYVHGVVSFRSTASQSQAISRSITAKGGALKLHEGYVSRADLEKLHDQIELLQRYLTTVLNALKPDASLAPLASLEKPPLPDKLELNRLRLIERKRPPQSFHP